MDEQKKNQGLQQETPGQVSMVVIVPAWLQEAISVLLDAATNISVLAITHDVQAALSDCQTCSPRLALFYGREDLQSVCEDVGRLKAAWPWTRCIVMVDRLSDKELVQDAGADQVLIKGISPSQLMHAIDIATEELAVEENQKRTSSL